MAVSMKALQNEITNLERLCPTLLPIICPSYLNEDIFALISNGEDFALVEKKCLKRHTKGINSCSICHSKGKCGSISEQDLDALHLTPLSKVDLGNKCIQVLGIAFACGRCRALQDVKCFMHDSLINAGVDNPERTSVIQELMYHFASINGAPKNIVENNDALAIWVQEVYSRAYSLVIILSNIPLFSCHVSIHPASNPLSREDNLIKDVLEACRK